jgi:Holliday junction resolvase RusA-like endonuclease
MEPRWGEKYEVWIEGEPVPKSTMKPPVIRKPMSPRARAICIQRIIATDPKYAPLKRTQEYQHYVAVAIWNALDEFPQFEKIDPIKLTFTFHKEKHARGDLKNLKAAAEDGIQHSARIPDDGQVTTHGESSIHYYSNFPGTKIVAEIDPLAEYFEWLYGWFKQSRKKTLEYAKMREIKLKNVR